MSGQLQFNELNVSLKTYAKLVSSGSRMTRQAARISINEPNESQDGNLQETGKNKKTHNKKTQKKSKNIKKGVSNKSNYQQEAQKDVDQFLGDVSLKQFLGAVEEKHDFEALALQQLDKGHIPQLTKFLEKSPFIEEFEIKEAKICPRKTRNNEWILDITHTGTRTITKEHGYIINAQTLVFYLLDQKAFSHLFSPEIQAARNTQTASASAQLTIINQEQEEDKQKRSNEEIIGQKCISNNEEDMVAEQQDCPKQLIKQIDERQQVLPISQRHAGEFPSKLKPSLYEEQLFEERSPLLAVSSQIVPQAVSPQMIQMRTSQFVSELKEHTVDSFQPIQNFETSLFSQLAAPGCNYILWPAVIYQPLNCTDEQVSKVIQKNLITDLHSNPNLFRNLCKGSVFQEKTATNSPLIQELIEKGQKVKTVVNLLGTMKYICPQEKCIPWKLVPADVIKKIMAKPVFNLFVGELNQIINVLNKFYMNQFAEPKADDGRRYFMRLAHFKEDKAEENNGKLCIPLRINNTQGKKLVLIKLIQKASSGLQWVPITQLTVNYSCPQLQPPELYLLYLHQVIDLQRLLTVMMASYLQKPSNLHQLFAQVFNEGMKKVSEFISLQKCLECYFPIHNSSFVQCYFCCGYIHCQCAQSIEDSELPNRQWLRKYCQYIVPQKKVVWICGRCEPCNLCLTAVGSNSLKCKECGSSYHYNCGKIKTIIQYSINLQNFVCEICLKCKMCKKKLRDKQYNQIDKELFCSGCSLEIEKQQHCPACMQDKKQIWLQCGQPNCKKWLHVSCDSYLLEKKLSKKDLEKIAYWCSKCRSHQCRRIIDYVINVLASFDEYAFYTDPFYENLFDYSHFVHHPMCFTKMKEKCYDGKYDGNGFEFLKADFQLLIDNALIYNMPKDAAHYRARILKILGEIVLEKFQPILNCSPQELIEGDVFGKLQNTEREIYTYVYAKYPQILLNYKSKEVRVEVNKDNRQQLPKKLALSSKIFLNNFFDNCSFKITFKKQPPKIENLFDGPRHEDTYYLPIGAHSNRHHNGYICYYHPQDGLPIIYSCPLCYQSYCCITTCYKHQMCVCGTKGCGCQQLCSNNCYNNPLEMIKEKKTLQAKITSIHPEYTLQELTQNYTYCLKCTSDRRFKICYLCHKICLYEDIFYEICQHCGKTYHKYCEADSLFNNLARPEERFEGISSDYYTLSSLIPKTCQQCCKLPSLIESFYQKLLAANKLVLLKLKSIHSKLGIIKTVYASMSISIPSPEIIRLLYEQYEQFSEMENILDQFAKNYQIIMKEVEGYSTDIIKTKLAINKNVFPIESIHYLRQAKHSTLIQTLGLQSENQTLCIYKVNRPFANSQFVPLDKANMTGLFILEHYNKRQPLALSLQQIQLLYYNETNQQQNQFLVQHTSNELHSQYQKYLNYVALYSIKYKCNQPASQFQPRKSNGILCQNRPIINCFNSNEYPSMQTLLPYLSRTQESPKFGSQISRRKAFQIHRIVTNFLAEIYENSKKVYRRGNTCIVRSQQNFWRVLKKYPGIPTLDLKLYKLRDRWFFAINQVVHHVSAIQDIVRHLGKIPLTVPLKSFKDLAQFLGFHLRTTNCLKANHYTHFLQTNPLDKMTQMQRRQKVIHVYDEYIWGTDGRSYLRKGGDFQIKKNPPFYLSKRQKVKQKDEVEAPYISYQDLKKDFNESGFVGRTENIGIKTPTNSVFIAPSKIHKLGLFIREYTRKGTIVVEYIGEIISEGTADKREALFRQGCYMFGLNRKNTDRKNIIDATFKGNMGRYLNHSCEPNCRAKVEVVNKHPRIFIYTIRDVEQYEELTYDYQFAIGKSNEQKIVCMCGARNCQGRLN